MTLTAAARQKLSWVSGQVAAGLPGIERHAAQAGVGARAVSLRQPSRRRTIRLGTPALLERPRAPAGLLGHNRRVRRPLASTLRLVWLGSWLGLSACNAAHSVAPGGGAGSSAQPASGGGGGAAQDGGGPESVVGGRAADGGELARSGGGAGSSPISTAASGHTGPDAGASDPAASGGTASSSPWQELCSFRAHSTPGGIVADQAQKNHEALIDSQGDLVLIASFGGTLSVGATTLAAGGQEGAVVIKLDRDCKPVWAKSFGGQGYAEVWFTAIARDETDNLYLSGGIYGTTDLGDATVNGEGTYYGFLLKLDPQGAVVWKQIYTSTAAAVAVTDLVTDAQHRITLVGYGGADTSLGGAPIGFLYAASIPFLAQLTTDGAFGWSETFDSGDLLYGLADGPHDDGIVLTGWGSQQVDLGSGPLSLGKGGRFLAKLDPSGAQQWLRALPHGADVDQWNWWKGGVAVDARGAIDVLRDEPQTLPGDSGARVLDDSVEQYAPDGTTAWQRRASDATVFDHEWGSALALFSDGGPLRFGSFTGTTTYGGQTLTSRGGSDVVLLELSPDGEPLSTRALGGELDDRALGVAVDQDDHVFAVYVGDETESGDLMDLVVTKLGR